MESDSHDSTVNQVIKFVLVFPVSNYSKDTLTYISAKITFSTSNMIIYFLVI